MNIIRLSYTVIVKKSSKKAKEFKMSRTFISTTLMAVFQCLKCLGEVIIFVTKS